MSAGEGEVRVAPAWSLGVLAGGFSRRFGRDKAMLPFGQGTLLQHQATRLAPPGVPVLVGTRPDGPGRDAGLDWVPDLYPGEGPLSAIASLLERVETPYLLAVPCDQPLLPPDLGDRMLEHAPGLGAVLLIAGDVLQPLPVLLARELFPLIVELLEAGERKANAYVDRAPAALIPFEKLYPRLDPANALLNVNDDFELERALAALGLSRRR